MAQKFTDDMGVEWTVLVNIPTGKRVLQETGFNIMQIYVLDELKKLIQDEFLLADVVLSICKPQWQERGLTTDQFYSRLTGDAFEDAVTAIIESLADHLPTRKGELLREMLKKSEHLDQELVDKAMQAIDKIGSGDDQSENGSEAADEFPQGEGSREESRAAEPV